MEIEHHEARKTPTDLWERIRSELSWQDIDNKQVGKAIELYLSGPNGLPDIAQRDSLYLYYIVE